MTWSSNEWEERFDVEYNNITSNQAPGLNTHEKSVFLTKGENEVLKNYFNPKGNKYQEGFDGNQKRQIDFSAITSVDTKSSGFAAALFDTRSNSKSVALPSDVWMLVNEKVEVTRENKPVVLTVKAISYNVYDDLMSKPFKRPVKYQAWRLINNDASNKSDLIVGPSDTITKYIVRYVRRPKPIIIGDLDGLTIDGYTWGGETTPASPEAGKIYGDNPCELDPILYEEILQRAVELAKTAWTSTGNDNTQAVIQAGQRSE